MRGFLGFRPYLCGDAAGFEPIPEDPPAGPNDGGRVGPLAFIEDPG